ENWRATVSSFKTETAEGFHYIRVKPGLLDLFVMQGVITFFIAPLGVLLPFFVEDTLHSTPKWYGFLMAGLAFGVTLGSVVSTVIKIAPAKKGKLGGSALILYSLCLIGVGYSQTVVTALLVLMVMGVCSGLMYVLVNSVIQRSTPGEIRGRVFGLLTTATFALTPISMGLAGIVADLVNHDITLIYTGCGICTLIATLMLLLREGLHQLLSGDDYSVNSV
ncbi:MAG: MFS transporter, partial [Exilibacterium sp.]